MKQFKVSATGGTFDVLHKGHMIMLATSFEKSDSVIIGVCTDKMAFKKGKKLQNTYDVRLANLREALEKNFPDAEYSTSPLEDDFGPAVLQGKVEALVASEETSHKVKELNSKREKIGLPVVSIVEVPMVKAYDGEPISSTRIRCGEVDSEGRRL